MHDIVKIEDGFYILSTSSRVDDRKRVLKNGDAFAVFDRFGDIEGFGSGTLGVYYRDTRFLSTLVLRLAGQRPLLLSSTIKDDNAALAVDLMNPDIRDASEASDVSVPRGILHIFRSKLLWKSACHERLRIHNYGTVPVDIAVTLEFDADFRDIFEVRGVRRERRGSHLPTKVTSDTVLLAYEGLDRRVRATRLVFTPAPNDLSQGEARYLLRLAPQAATTYSVEMTCEEMASREFVAADIMTARSTSSYEDAAAASAQSLTESRSTAPSIVTSNNRFNDWLARSASDLHLMDTETAHGHYPYAGVPWFSTAFGRDGVIAGLEYLWFKPQVAQGVLRYLAATQADKVCEEQDAQPGKILHETRAGEMAALGEVPFGRYYGSVDSTPLFVMLAGAYYEQTGDLSLVREIWGNIERALTWIERYGDADGDGFVEYARQSLHGLVQQGWKDSYDSIFHADGTLAEPPIALCEVQGYAYAARTAAALLARALGMDERADALASAAATLRSRFEEAFWCEDIGCYALALDGRKKPCRVVTSNAGHCLFSGIADDNHARRVAHTLLGERCFSGWGIRTVATTELRYNPMSYHNGSVWPHDNALVAAGFARYGMRREASRVLSALFDAAQGFELHRPPELFCGFHRRLGETPTLYPVACSPQTWASGAVFMLLAACLGLQVNGTNRTASFHSPMLPDAIDEMKISGLPVADARVDLAFTRHGNDVAVNVLRRVGACSVVVQK